jgi:hypothetical protein
MKAMGLGGRIVYALVVAALAGAGGFYGCMLLFRMMWVQLEYPAADGAGGFSFAIGLGALLAFTGSLIALTQPGRRRRKRRGRLARAIVSSVIVLLGSIVFAAEGHAVVLDLALPVWLAYTLTFTFVRYGVLDQSSREQRADGPAAASPAG